MTIYASEIMCGVGGATRGFLDAGIQVIRGIDIDGSCKKTYEENNAPAVFLERDVKNLKTEDVIGDVTLGKDDKFILIACPPCQPYSRAGLGKPKDSLEIVKGISRIIKDLKPDFVFAENAPGFWKCYPPIYQEFLKSFNELNYSYDCAVKNLKDYGIPQNRRRYLFVASRDYQICLPKRTHGRNLLPYVTVKDKIKKYPPLRPGGQSKSISNHTCYNLTPITIERLKHTKKNGGSRTDWPTEYILDCHKKAKGHSDVYGRMKWNSVAPTLTCRCISVSNGRFVHPTQNRGISVREAAALQTFGDNFVFFEPKSIAAKHIGNAVPPLIAQVIANTILGVLKNARATSILEPIQVTA